MGNIGDSISDSAPSVGTAGPGYATTINSLLTELKARLIAKIPLSSLLTNSNLDLNGQALLNAGYITMVNEGVSPVASPANRLAAYGGDLWWVSPAGALQISSGANLNAAGVGGITGDYSGAGPMEFRYDTANTRYDAFANQATNTWAYVRARAFDIAGGATSAFRARLAFGGTANATYTLPAAAPATTQIVTMSSAGALAVDGILGANTDIAVSGTGEYNHGDKKICVSPLVAMTISGGGHSFGSSSNATYCQVATNGIVHFPINGVRENDRIKKVVITALGTNEPGVTVFLQVGNACSVLASTQSGSWSGGGEITATLTTPNTISGQNDTIYARVVSAGGTVTNVYSVYAVYDRP